MPNSNPSTEEHNSTQNAQDITANNPQNDSEERQKGAIENFTTALEKVDIKTNKAYSGVTTDLELAAFSALAYKTEQQHTQAEQAPPDDDHRLRWWHVLHKNGWRIHAVKEGEQGFRATAYIHEARKQVIIAFRGTEPKEPVTFWIDHDEVLNNNLGSHSEQAYAFVEHIKQTLQNKQIAISSLEKVDQSAYQLAFTGHSLGAWLASSACSASDFHYPSIVFDSPGAKTIDEKYRQGDVLTTPADTRIRPITSYLGHPNLINTAHPHIGRAFQLTTAAPSRCHSRTDIVAEAKYSLAQHSIELITATFDPETGKPRQGQVKIVKKWPFEGAVAAKQLLSIFPEAPKELLYLVAQYYFTGVANKDKALNLLFKAVRNFPKAIQQLISYRKKNPNEILVDVLDMLCGLHETTCEIDKATHYDYSDINIDIPKSAKDKFNQRFKSHYQPDDVEHNEILPELQLYLNQYRRTVIDENRLKFDVPTSTENNIVRRKALLGNISRQFQQNQLANQSSVNTIILYAPGGVGKTELAKQFANEAYQKTSHDNAVIWLAAGDDLLGSYQKLGYDLLGEQAKQLKPDELLTQIKQKLSQKYESILFVFDNAEDHNAIKPYLEKLPNASKVQVLITTRNEQSFQQVSKLPVDDGFEKDEAIEYIRLSLPEYTVTDNEARSLAEVVYCHPLSLFYLIGHIRTRHITIAECLEHYGKERLNLLNEVMLGHGDNKQKEQGMAMLFSLKQLTEQSPLARQILDVCGFLAADDISKELLKTYFHDIDEKELEEALVLLNKSSLLNTVSGRPGHYRTHRLLQEIVHYQLEQSAGYRLNTVKKLLTFFTEQLANYKDIILSPTKDFDAKEEKRQQCIHAAIFCKQIVAILPESMKKEYADLLSETASNSNYSAKYKQAEELYQQALTIYRNIHKTDTHPDVASCLMGLGIILSNQGNDTKAEELYQQALTIYRNIHKTDTHPGVASCLMGLGIILSNQGNDTKAEELYQQALTIYRNIHKTDTHPDVASCLMSLGIILSNQGNNTKAEELCQQALTIYRNIYQTDIHPNVAGCLINLGNTFHRQGNHAKAEQYYQQALTSFRNIYQTDIHPNVAHCLMSLGIMLSNQGNYPKAKEYLQNAFNIFSQTLGKQHPYTKRVEALLEQCTQSANEWRITTWFKKIIKDVKAEEALLADSSANLLMNPGYEQLLLNENQQADTTPSLGVLAAALFSGGITGAVAKHAYNRYQQRQSQPTSGQTNHFMEPMPELARSYRLSLTFSQHAWPKANTTQATQNFFNTSSRISFNFFTRSTAVTPSSSPTSNAPTAANLQRVARFGRTGSAALLGTMAVGATLYGGWQMIKQNQQAASVVPEKEEISQAQTKSSADISTPN